MKGLEGLEDNGCLQGPSDEKVKTPGFVEEEKEEEEKKFPYYAMLLTLLFLGLIVLWSPLDVSPFAQKSARRFFGDVRGLFFLLSEL